MDFECSQSFSINFAGTIDASISLGDVSVSQRSGDDADIWDWVVEFIYQTGDPPATGFRLNSADSLAGNFTPFAPEGAGAAVRSGMLTGTVQRIPGVEGDITYNGTITILQA